uniref:CCHC-type domain-containing protein n=1 Tax=Oryza punctata TaxID=4537 RepID=A0A0E0M631_ORYPU
MDDGRSMTIIGTEITPEDAARILKRLRGNTFRGARQLTRHLRWYGPPSLDVMNQRRCSLKILMMRSLKVLLKACTSCREVGYIVSRCTQTCLCGEDTHLLDECHMRKVTCFLCEGTDHVPKGCQLNLVLAKAKEDQWTTKQPIHQPMVVSDNSTTPNLQLSPTSIEVISGSRSTANKVHESPLTPVSVLGHHISKCPFPRPKKLVHRCFNCGEADHLFEGFPKPKRKHPQVTRNIRNTPTPQVATAPAQHGRIETRHTRKPKNTNLHLNVQPPPQRIVVKGTVKCRIVPPTTASNLRN